MSKVIEATLPLSPENQVQYFKDKSIQFLIDIENSPISPKQCLMTLSNMQLSVQVKSVSHETLYEYMKSKYLVRAGNLSKVMANALFAYKYQVLPYKDVEDLFSIDDYAVFVEKHQDILLEWSKIIEAIPMYLLFCSVGFAEKDLEILEQQVSKVEGAIEGVGANISQIVSMPEFLTMFLDEQSIEYALEQNYYTHYFDEYIYSGKKLLSFLASKEHQSDFAIDVFSLTECFKNNDVTIKGEQA